MAQQAKTLITNVAQKTSTSLSDPYETGASFENVIDTRKDGNKYTLAQFFDNYVSFMKEASFIYTGSEKPKNNHIKVWIDTGTNNIDHLKD